MADQKISAPGTRTGAPAPAQSAEQRFAVASQNRIAAELFLDKISYSDAPGSKYQKALAAYKKAQAEEQAASQAVDAERGKKKAAKSSAKVTSLQTERKRLIDKGATEDDPRVKEIDDKIKSAGGTPTVNVVTGVPSAIKPRPGVMPPAGLKPAGTTPAATSPAATSGVPSTLGPTGGTPVKSGTPTGAGKIKDTTVDKTAWVSWMRQTFKTLDDTNERAIINDLLDTAKKQNWTETQFMDALDQKSTWWRNELPTLQQFFLDSNDPRKKGEFQQKITNSIDAVEASLEKLGVNLNRVDPITGKVMTSDQYAEAVKGVALEAIKNGWDSDQTQNYLATKVDVVFSGGGTIGTASSRVKSWADRYGISLSDSYTKNINASLLDPNDGRDEQWWINEMQRQSAEQYAPFAGGLAQGRTLSDMTNTYRETMAKYLEVDPTDISWKDLMGYAVNSDDKGNQTKATMSDFVKKVKQNPMWQYTRNAKETYTSMGMDLLKEFGIVG